MAQFNEFVPDPSNFTNMLHIMPTGAKVSQRSPRRERNMATGKKPAKAASKLLSDKSSSSKVKKVAGSDLAQTPKKKKSKP